MSNGSPSTTLLLLRQFLDTLMHAARNLLPIVIVVVGFQWFVLQQVPDGTGGMIVGLGIVVLGVALFLQGLEMGIFPIGRSLSDEFTAKGSMPWLVAFGFCLGFSAVIAVAEQGALPIIMIILFFQFAVIRKLIPRLPTVVFGFFLVIVNFLTDFIGHRPDPGRGYHDQSSAGHACSPQP